MADLARVYGIPNQYTCTLYVMHCVCIAISCTRAIFILHILLAQVNSAAFSHNHGNKLGSNYFVTVHHRRVQYWYYDTVGKDSKVRTSRYM
jgi:hypothetical protein